ncbi:Benzyl alcohol O-benzoyltransferase [Quillaja saponaria]|uniref:Benzyl alcohol O-benzoyltransferase n=1 Tax=Quillaja saponaria TaxID=32244 RepID=A0AAD7KNE6_QUISA|nr:Benzyl alcohol O-benzoyltransferase [Quillaja saponaria]
MAKGFCSLKQKQMSHLTNLVTQFNPHVHFLTSFLHQVPGSEGITGCPLLLIQVTRLLCGGFVFAVRLNHTMADSLGLAQFLKAVAEFARGATELSVSPVWERHILNARDPPRITCTHNEYDLETNNKAYQIMEENHNMINESFYFGPKEINAIRKHVQERCTTFELLTACLWKCRTVALEFDPEEIVRLSITVNLRGKKHQNLHIPSGYYGNGFGFPAVTSKAGLVCENSLGYVVELVKKGKSEMSEEYIKSVADLMEIKGQPGLVLNGNFIVSDNTRVGFGEIDFGWGKALCAGPANALTLISFYSQYRSRGEEGIAVPICLPEFAMERFCQELKRMTGKP